MVLLSIVNPILAYSLADPPKPSGGEPSPSENPVIKVTHTGNLILDHFNFSFANESLIVSFMNGSKKSDVIGILVYVNTSRVFGLNGLTLGIDRGAQIKNIVLDLCDSDLRIKSSYKDTKKDEAKTKLSIDDNDMISKASSVKITVSIGNQSPNQVHKLTISPEHPIIGPGEFGSPPSGSNIFVIYDAKGKALDTFNVSSTENGMDIVFSNASAEVETIDLIVYVGLDAS